MTLKIILLMMDIFNSNEDNDKIKEDIINDNNNKINDNPSYFIRKVIRELLYRWKWKWKDSRSKTKKKWRIWR